MNKTLVGYIAISLVGMVLLVPGRASADKQLVKKITNALKVTEPIRQTLADPNAKLGVLFKNWYQQCWAVASSNNQCVAKIKLICSEKYSTKIGLELVKSRDQTRGQIDQFSVEALESLGCASSMDPATKAEAFKTITDGLNAMARAVAKARRSKWYAVRLQLYPYLHNMAQYAQANRRTDVATQIDNVKGFARTVQLQLFKVASANPQERDEHKLQVALKLLKARRDNPAAGNATGGVRPVGTPPPAGAPPSPGGKVVGGPGAGGQPAAAAPVHKPGNKSQLSIMVIILAVGLGLVLLFNVFLLMSLRNKADQADHDKLKRRTDKVESQTKKMAPTARPDPLADDGARSITGTQDPNAWQDRPGPKGAQSAGASTAEIEELKQQLKKHHEHIVKLTEQVNSNEQFNQVVEALNRFTGIYDEQLDECKDQIASHNSSLDDQFKEAASKIQEVLHQKLGADPSQEAGAQLGSSTAGQQIQAAIRLYETFAAHPEEAAEIRRIADKLQPIWGYAEARQQVRKLGHKTRPAATGSGLEALVQGILGLQEASALRQEGQKLTREAAGLASFKFDSTGVRTLAQAVFKACQRLNTPVTQEMLQDLDQVARAAELRLLVPSVGERVVQKECEIEPRGGTGQRPGTILEVLQPGFKDSQGRVLEAARAVVAS